MSKRVSITSFARNAAGALAAGVAVPSRRVQPPPQPDDTVYPLLATGLALKVTHDRADTNEGEGPYTTGLRKRFKDLSKNISESRIHHGFKTMILRLLKDAMRAGKLELLSMETAISSLLTYLAPPGGRDITHLKLPLTLPDTARISEEHWNDFTDHMNNAETMLKLMNDREYGRTLVGVMTSLGVWALLSSTRAQLQEMDEDDERMRYAEHVVGFPAVLDVIHDYICGLVDVSPYRHKLQALYPAPAVGAQGVNRDRGAELINQLMGSWSKDPGAWLQDCLRQEGRKDVEELRLRLSAEAEAELAPVAAFVMELEKAGHPGAQAAAKDLEDRYRTATGKVTAACADLQLRREGEAQKVRSEMAGWDLAAADIKAKLSQVLAGVQQAAPSERARVWCLGLYDALYVKIGTDAMARCLEPVALAEAAKVMAANHHIHLRDFYWNVAVGMGGLCPSGVLAQTWKRGVEGLERSMETACDADDLEGGVGALLANRSEHVYVLRAGVGARGRLRDLMPDVAPRLEHWDRKLTNILIELKRSKAEAKAAGSMDALGVTAAATQATVDLMAIELRDMKADMKADMRKQAREAAQRERAAAEETARLMEMCRHLMHHVAGEKRSRGPEEQEAAARQYGEEGYGAEETEEAGVDTELGQGARANPECKARVLRSFKSTRQQQQQQHGGLPDFTFELPTPRMGTLPSLGSAAGDVAAAAAGSAFLPAAKVAFGSPVDDEAPRQPQAMSPLAERLQQQKKRLRKTSEGVSKIHTGASAGEAWTQPPRPSTEATEAREEAGEAEVEAEAVEVKDTAEDQEMGERAEAEEEEAAAAGTGTVAEPAVGAPTDDWQHHTGMDLPAKACSTTEPMEVRSDNEALGAMAAQQLMRQQQLDEEERRRDPRASISFFARPPMWATGGIPVLLKKLPDGGNGGPPGA